MIVEFQVSTGLDDVEELATGETYLNSSDLEFVDDTFASRGPDQTVGMRFTGVNIPQGAIITNAYLQFQVDEVSTGSVSLSISGELVDDALAFSTATGDVSSRQTTPSVAWVPPDWTVVGSTQQTPDLKTIVQEIVSLSGWAANNAMVFIVTGFGTRTAESYEGSASGLQPQSQEPACARPDSAGG